MSADRKPRPRYCTGEGPECPHCKTEYTADDPYFYNEKEFRMDCDECGKAFTVCPEVTVTWLTMPIKSPGPSARKERLHKDRPWSEYPVGTKAYAVTGGWWYKTPGGWKWGGPDGPGGTFPTPGGDACGACVELPCEATGPSAQRD